MRDKVLWITVTVMSVVYCFFFCRILDITNDAVVGIHKEISALKIRIEKIEKEAK